MPTSTETENRPAPPLPPPPGPREVRRLRRSRDQRVVFGVAGGVAEYFGLDVAIVRIVIVVLSITTGVPILLYLVAIFCMPKAPRTPKRDEAPLASAAVVSNRGPSGATSDELGPPPSRSLGAVVLIAVGALLLLDRVGLRFRSDLVWPLAFVGIGAAVLWSRRCPSAEREASPPPPPPPPGAAAAAPGWSDPSTRIDRREIDAELDAVHPFAPFLAQPNGEPTERFAPATQPARAHERTFFARIGLSLWAFTVGAAALVVGFVPGIDLSLRTGTTLALLWLGVLLAAGSVLGRPRLTALGAVLVLAVALLSTVRVDVRGGAGDRLYVPTSADALPSEYRLGVGSLKLDLSKLRIGKDTTVKVSVGVGETIIDVPPGVRVATLLDVDLGEATVFGKVLSGGISERLVSEGGVSEGAVSEGASAPPTLTLDVSQSIGEVVVQRSGGLR